MQIIITEDFLYELIKIHLFFNFVFIHGLTYYYFHKICNTYKIAETFNQSLFFAPFLAWVVIYCVLNDKLTRTGTIIATFFIVLWSLDSVIVLLVISLIIYFLTLPIRIFLKVFKK